jgi:hypothetical protein
VRQDGLCKVHGSADVDVEIDVPLVGVGLDEWPKAAGTPGTVDKDIDAPVFVKRLLDRRIDLDTVGDIHLDCGGLAAGFPYCGGGLFGTLFIDVAANDVATFPGESTRAIPLPKPIWLPVPVTMAFFPEVSGP